MTGTPEHGTSRPRRPRPDQPLRARWDPIADGSATRTGRTKSEPDDASGGALRRLVRTYGWRIYALPVLLVLTVALLVVTVRGGDGSSNDSNEGVGDGVRNPKVQSETTPIGAPSGSIQEAALPAGALPAGPPYTTKGKKTFRVVPGTTDKVGTGGEEFTYTIEVEDGVKPAQFGGDQTFATMVQDTLANPKSWIGGGKVSFRRIDKGEPDLRISMTSTDTTRELCGYQIKLNTSCYYPPDKRVVLNEARWVRGAIAFQGDGLTYRQYLVNHEVGHGIGYEKHQACKEDGALAPIMMQQTFGTANSQVIALDPGLDDADRTLVCRPNAWPYPNK